MNRYFKDPAIIINLHGTSYINKAGCGILLRKGLIPFRFLLYPPVNGRLVSGGDIKQELSWLETNENIGIQRYHYIYKYTIIQLFEANTELTALLEASSL